MSNLKVKLIYEDSSNARLSVFDKELNSWEVTEVSKSNLTSFIDQIVNIEGSTSCNNFYILLDSSSKDLAFLELPLTIEERVISSVDESSLRTKVVISDNLSSLESFSFFDKKLTNSSQTEISNILTNG